MSSASVPPAEKSTSGLGIAALVLGVLSLLIALFVPYLFIIGIPLGAIGALLGLIAVIISLAGGKSGVLVPLLGTIISAGAAIYPIYQFTAAVSGVVADAQKQHEAEKAKLAEAKLVTVAELVKEYKDDPKKADEKFKDKPLRIKGKVKDLSGGLKIVFETDDKGESKKTVEAHPQLMTIATLEKDCKVGQEATVGGKFAGQVGNALTLNEAVVLK